MSVFICTSAILLTLAIILGYKLSKSKWSVLIKR
jgi:hypothetical protein